MAARVWKGHIIRLLTSELRYADYVCHWEEQNVYREERRSKRQGKTGLEIERATGPLWADVFMARDEYQKLLSRKWERAAFKLSVPLPEKRPYRHDQPDDPSGYWQMHSSEMSWFLSEKGIHHVRGEVRRVQKTERERWFPWLTFAVASAALVIGLINLF